MARDHVAEVLDEQAIAFFPRPFGRAAEFRVGMDSGPSKQCNKIK